MHKSRVLGLEIVYLFDQIRVHLAIRLRVLLHRLSLHLSLVDYLGLLDDLADLALVIVQATLKCLVVFLVGGDPVYEYGFFHNDLFSNGLAQSLDGELVLGNLLFQEADFFVQSLDQVLVPDFFDDNSGASLKLEVSVLGQQILDLSLLRIQESFQLLHLHFDLAELGFVVLNRNLLAHIQLIELRNLLVKLRLPLFLHLVQFLFNDAFIIDIAVALEQLILQLQRSGVQQLNLAGKLQL